MYINVQQKFEGIMFDSIYIAGLWDKVKCELRVASCELQVASCKSIYLQSFSTLKIAF